MPRAVSEPVVTVIGEALIDLVPNGSSTDFTARPGGSPFNVAVGLARLGYRTALMARLGADAFGRILRARADAEQLDLSFAAQAQEPTTLAVVSLDAARQASYDFYVDGTADWQWTAAELARMPVTSSIYHFGSVASWMSPGSHAIHDVLAGLHGAGTALISYDPNVRPALLGDRVRARTAVHPSVAASNLVKASREDIEWLYPDEGIEQVCARWAELGALLTVVTDGANGAFVCTGQRAMLHRPGVSVPVLDTIGAGDAFMSGLLGGLLRRGVRTPADLARVSTDVLGAIVDEAILVSSLTCQRAGADPPRIRTGTAPSAQTPLTREDFDA
jgi:fructokinase